MRRVYKFIGVICILVLGSLLIERFSNDSSANSLYTNFEKIEHPSESRFIAKLQKVGVFSGNGNHCDFLVGQIREANSEVESLRKFYESQKVIGIDQEELKIILWRPGQDFEGYPLNEIRDELEKIRSPAKYAVFVIQYTPYSGLDFRCH